MRESHLHHSEFYKDCIITSNQADIETIRALDQTHTVSLPVNCEHNKLEIDGIKDHCEQSAEFIAGADVNVICFCFGIIVIDIILLLAFPNCSKFIS